jgi:hypothetical protein
VRRLDASGGSRSVEGFKPFVPEFCNHIDSVSRNATRYNALFQGQIKQGRHRGLPLRDGAARVGVVQLEKHLPRHSSRGCVAISINCTAWGKFCSAASFTQ